MLLLPGKGQTQHRPCALFPVTFQGAAWPLPGALPHRDDGRLGRNKGAIMCDTSYSLGPVTPGPAWPLESKGYKGLAPAELAIPGRLLHTYHIQGLILE